MDLWTLRKSTDVFRDCASHLISSQPITAHHSSEMLGRKCGEDIRGEERNRAVACFKKSGDGVENCVEYTSTVVDCLGMYGMCRGSTTEYV